MLSDGNFFNLLGQGKPPPKISNLISWFSSYFQLDTCNTFKYYCWFLVNSGLLITEETKENLSQVTLMFFVLCISRSTSKMYVPFFSRLGNLYNIFVAFFVFTGTSYSLDSLLWCILSMSFCMFIHQHVTIGGNL